MTTKTEAPESIWAWKWNLGGVGKFHDTTVWAPFKPKIEPVRRFISTGKWWQVFKGDTVKIEQDVTGYIRADLYTEQEVLIGELLHALKPFADTVFMTDNRYEAMDSSHIQLEHYRTANKARNAARKAGYGV